MQNLYVWAVSWRVIYLSVLVFLSLGEVEKGPLPSCTATPSLRCTSLVGSLAGAVSLVEDGEGERCLSGEYRRFPSRCRTSGHRVEAISGFCVVGNQKAHTDVDSPPVFLLGLAGGSCLFWDSPCLFSSNSCRTSVTLVGDIDLGLLCVAAPPIRFLGWGTTTIKKIKLVNICQIHTFHKKELKK